MKNKWKNILKIIDLLLMKYVGRMKSAQKSVLCMNFVIQRQKVRIQMASRNKKRKAKNSFLDSEKRQDGGKWKRVYFFCKRDRSRNKNTKAESEDKE